MPQIVSPQTGNLAGGTDSSGNAMGAVIFDKPDNSGAEMLFNALQNNAKRMDDQHLQNQKQGLARQLALSDGIDIDKTGVFEKDLQYFQDRTKGITDKIGAIYNKYGGDLTSKEALQDVNKVEGEKAQLKMEALLSKNDKEMYNKLTNDLASHPEKYHPEQSALGLSNYAKATLGNRASVQTLVERPPILMDIMDKHSKTIGDDTEITGTYTENGKLIHKSIKGKSPEKVNVAFQTLYQANPDARSVADLEFAKLPEYEKQNMEAIKAISGQVNVPTAQIWLGTVASNNYSTKNTTLKSLGNNMYEQDRLIRGRMGYGQQLKSEDKESAIYKLTSAYASGDAPDMATEITRFTPNGQEKIMYAPASLKSGVFTVDVDGKPTNVENAFLGTMTRDVTINGKPRKITYKIDTKTLVDKGIITKKDINAQTGVANITGNANELQSKIVAKLDEFPVMNASDAIFIAKANGASDKAIEATNKNYGAYSGGGIVDVTKINKQTTPEKRDIGQAIPKVEVKKEQFIDGKKIPANATPKYSKTTGKLIGYELSNGEKFKF